MNLAMYIEIPKDSVRKAIAFAYSRSRPQGMGMLHFQPGELTEEEIDAIEQHRGFGTGVVDMDYIKGRACKFTIRKGDTPEDEDRRFIDPSWHDHTRDDLVAMLDHLEVADADAKIDAALKAQEEYYAALAKRSA